MAPARNKQHAYDVGRIAAERDLGRWRELGKASMQEHMADLAREDMQKLAELAEPKSEFEEAMQEFYRGRLSRYD